MFAIATAKSFATLARDYWALGKPRLSLLVAFSAAMGMLTVSARLDDAFWAVVAGGFLITLSANAVNQMLERPYDALMRRTSVRPLPAGRLTDEQALGFAAATGTTGLTLMLWYAKPAAAFFSAVSFALYVWAYTPLKRLTPWAVAVGAIPGALPPLIGRVAVAKLDAAAWTLFAIQFFWQLPHFWAIARLAEEDYRRAGFRLFPTGGPATHALLGTIPLTGAGFAAQYAGLTDDPWPLTILGIIYAFFAFLFWRNPDRKHALRLLFASFFHLPLALAFTLKI
ncbi:MAG: heme o synthase [Bacteroidia bacterium]|nr:heme o synthase [Bacteroidia bacterium]MDW8334018.1 heme o synthase [Bacteroidia bacterium]